jgi:hypothetical protein
MRSHSTARFFHRLGLHPTVARSATPNDNPHIKAFFSTVKNVLSGQPTLNDKGMNIWQAVNGFCDKVMKGQMGGRQPSRRESSR